MARASCYLELEPTWSEWRTDHTGAPEVAGMRITRLLRTRPKRVHGPVVHLTLDVPNAAFKPLAPEVVVSVPEGALDYEPTVQVDMPGGEDDG